MALIGEMQYLKIGGNTYSIPVSGGSTVTIERALTSGTKSATISVDGTSYDLYAPTPNAGTVTSVGVSNATNGGLTISGSPITSSGTITIGHSNVLSSAQTTQAVYPIKIDKNGHISSYGTAINLEEMKFFLVTLTLTDESSGVYESDKTAKQIYDAFNAGRVVLLYVDGSYVLLSSVYGDGNYYQANFSKSEALTGSFILYEYIVVTDNNVTSVDSNHYETPVNNATLTIQKNGTTIKSFRANASSDVTANITVPTKISELTNDSGFITTETDPVFSASAAAGITATDISNWNAKVSDDKTWNGVELDTTGTTQGTTSYIPARSSISATTAYQVIATTEPFRYRIAKWDDNAYLYSTTPSANDNSTKVATTAYVDSAIDALPEPMVFKGSVGTGGTITTLPTAAASNKGHTYKVITALSSPSAKVGDIVISNGSEWIVIPSGGSVSFVTFSYDENTDTYSADRSVQELYNDWLDGNELIGVENYEGTGYSGTNFYKLVVVDTDTVANTIALTFESFDAHFFSGGVDLYRKAYTYVDQGATDVINCTGEENMTIPAYTAGTGIDITNGVISINLSNAEGGTY